MFEVLLVKVVDGLIAGGYSEFDAVKLVSDLFESVIPADEVIERISSSEHTRQRA